MGGSAAKNWNGSRSAATASRNSGRLAPYQETIESNPRRLSIGAIPGDDRIEPAQAFEQAFAWAGEFEQIETGGRDGPGMLRESGRQRHVPLRCPNFQIPGVQALHGRNGDDEIADGARADDEPLQELSIALIVRP